MNKILNIFRILLFIILLILNICCIFFKTGLVSCEHAIYLFIMCIILFAMIKDIIKKNIINNNKTYHVISILIFLVMGVVLFRTMFDYRFFFNNTDLISEYEKISKISGSYAGNFSAYAKLYLKQNMIYFNGMLVLLFIYRKINLSNNR